MTINGIGERAGNTALGRIGDDAAYADKIKFPLKTGIDTTQIARAQPHGQQPHRRSGSTE